MRSNPLVLSVLDAIVGVSSITLRYTALLFVRFVGAVLGSHITESMPDPDNRCHLLCSVVTDESKHPIGLKYLDRIYWSFAIFVLAFIGEALLVVRNGWIVKRRRGLALLLAWFDSDRPLSSALGFLANLLCLGAVLDFLFRGSILHQSIDLSFSRVGYVDSSSARVVIRAPISEYVEIVVTSDSTATEQQIQKPGPVLLDSKFDFTATFQIDGLMPNTAYTYSTNASHAGSFRTPSQPQDGAKRWSLVSSSCIKPFYPYSPLDHGLRIQGLEHLDSYLSTNPVDMVLFLGDFIYIDLPIPLGWDAEAYYTAYRQVYASPSWSPELRAMPWLHVYDDHEIINDWAGNETGLYGTAMQPFWNYHGHANPPSEFGAGKTYYTFRRGGVAFFVLDTRRYRSDNAMTDGPEKTMLGGHQLVALTEWLRTETDWKVVVSSVPFTRNWRGPDSADSWSGFLLEREVILDTMRRNGGAIILSGDRHEHATTKFPAKNPGDTPVIEFSTSPLNQFYEPFDRFHREIEETDISVYSHPWGISKFGVVSFDTADENRLLLHYDLVVDGNRVWEYDWEIRRDRS